MTHSILSWLSASFTRKIGGLSTILLSFILLVIIYSVIQLDSISREMRELAEIDIPLTEIASEFEMKQLEQHILLERTRLAASSTPPASVEQQHLNMQLIEHSEQVEALLDQAVTVANTALKQHEIVDGMQAHKELLQHLQAYAQSQGSFHARISESLAQPLSEVNAAALDAAAEQMDLATEVLLEQIERLTEEVAEITASHQQRFLLVDIALGSGAFVIGIYITLYLIVSFRRHMGEIQRKVDRLNHSLQGSSATKISLEPAAGDDELARLAANIDGVLDSFTSEMKNRSEVERQLLQLATTDKLTGALNRHKWDETLAQEIQLAKRGMPLSLLILDLDNFKGINDRWGHDVGDRVLVRTVELIRENVRSSDLIFRLGGEEFALLFRNHSKQQAAVVAEELRQIFEQLEEKNLPPFTASFGITQYESGDSQETLIKRADDALYQAKTNGRNRLELG
ncbi:GGDEF domain-containing protein [Marinobacterium mangrovicola]|uniref:diguanylate cyclase n=1 Tax=Marinobacterium mangrovicola TaxID=1476959 RepID=A0A4R1GDK0_9GAMM|nr:GGDEF domain-containing protein [Marinobacterium mangrovicola]TCK02312.1 diguanylate cyclase (GGDEF)-like protein [Marinobacterium mangrovicola]